MSPPATAESIINRVERRSPHVVELAELLGPAVRIEAALVRRLRVDLLPHLPAVVEAELWFSPLVQAHSVDNLALSVPIAVAFRQRLTRQWETGRQALLKRAREIYADVHAYLPPPLRLEEEVAWSLVAGDAEAAEAQLETALAALLAEPDRFRFWAGQAIARLPDGISMTTSGVRLTRAATGGELSGPGWEAAYRALATRPLAVRHIGPQLELGGPAGPGCRSIAVPGTAQVLLQLHWPSVSGGAAERVTVDPRDDAPTQVWGSGQVEVRTAAGVSYVVRDDPFERSCRVDPAADPRGELQSMLASPSVPGLRLAEDGEAAEMGVVLLDGRAALVDDSGAPFAAVPRLDPRDDSFAARAAAMAAHVSRWRTIAELRSGSPLLAGAIEVTVAGAGTKRGQKIDLTATDPATVTIANLGTGPLFVAVLALSSDWSVDVVIWDGGSSGLPPGDRWESVLRLNVLGPEQDTGFVRLVGVAAHHPFDPLPLVLPVISQASSSMPAPYVSSLVTKAPTIPTLDTEFAIMAGVPAASPVPRYLEWTTSEALVHVRRPNVPLPEGIDKIAIPPEPPDVPGVLERLKAIQRTFRDPLATAEPTDLKKTLADLKRDGRDGVVCFNHLYRVITA